MELLISIDDTDNLHTPGSGQLAALLAESLLEHGMALTCTSISRHQLYVHDEIRYTSHNSSMCFTADINGCGCDTVIDHAQNFLKKHSAEGSDPGLAVAIDSPALKRDLLDTFGLAAKNSILTKRDAYETARSAGVHLSEHGGDGGGVIGALAGIGLRVNGNDGRFRGWIKAGEAGRIVASSVLNAEAGVEGLVNEEGAAIRGDVPVYLKDERIKTVLIKHRRVIPLTGSGWVGADWETLSPAESKRF